MELSVDTPTDAAAALQMREDAAGIHGSLPIRQPANSISRVPAAPLGVVLSLAFASLYGLTVLWMQMDFYLESTMRFRLVFLCLFLPFSVLCLKPIHGFFVRRRRTHAARLDFSLTKNGLLIGTSKWSYTHLEWIELRQNPQDEWFLEVQASWKYTPFPSYDKIASWQVDAAFLAEVQWLVRCIQDQTGAVQSREVAQGLPRAQGTERNGLTRNWWVWVGFALLYTDWMHTAWFEPNRLSEMLVLCLCWGGCIALAMGRSKWTRLAYTIAVWSTFILLDPIAHPEGCSILYWFLSIDDKQYGSVLRRRRAT